MTFHGAMRRRQPKALDEQLNWVERYGEEISMIAEERYGAR